MTLDQLKTALQRVGFDASDPLTTWINAALHEFELAGEWNFLEDVVDVPVLPGDTDYTVLDSISAPVSKLLNARFITEMEPLVYISRTWFDEVGADPTITGIPTHYMLVGGDKMIFWPVPDTTLTMRTVVRKLVPDLASGSDVPAIPTRYHYGLVDGAAAKGLAAESNEERVSTHKDAFDNMIALAIDDDQPKSSGARTTKDVMRYGIS